MNTTAQQLLESGPQISVGLLTADLLRYMTEALREVGPGRGSKYERHPGHA